MRRRLTRLELHTILREELGKAHALRKGHDPDVWWRFEMETMLAAVNWYRAWVDKDPLPMKRLLRVEQVASGHVDYAIKLALYCTELVQEDP